MNDLYKLSHDQRYRNTAIEMAFSNTEALLKRTIEKPDVSDVARATYHSVLADLSLLAIPNVRCGKVILTPQQIRDGKIAIFTIPRVRKVRRLLLGLHP